MLSGMQRETAEFRGEAAEFSGDRMQRGFCHGLLGTLKEKVTL